MNCDRCTKNVNDDERVTCRGYCGGSFHALCAHVDKPLLDQLRSNVDCVFWMCGKCANLYCNDHFRNMTNRCDANRSDTNRCDTNDLRDTINDMKTDIAKLSNVVGTLVSKVDVIPSTPLLPPANAWNTAATSNFKANSAKRQRGNDGSIVTPNRKLQNMKGTRALKGSVQTVSLSNDQLFWVYLSAFHPSTTDEQIIALTRECVGLSNEDVIKATKLVPKNADISNMSFVSFKVGIGSQFKTTALSSETWPDDVSFREFVNYGSKNLPNVVKLTGNIINEPPSNQPQMDADQAAQAPINANS